MGNETVRKGHEIGGVKKEVSDGGDPVGAGRRGKTRKTRCTQEIEESRVETRKKVY